MVSNQQAPLDMTVPEWMVQTYGFERGLSHMTPWIQRDDLVLIEPAWLRGDLKRWMRVGVVGFVVGIESVHGNRQCSVDRV